MSLNTQILSVLKEAGRPMTTGEIAEAMSWPASAAFGVCNSLWMTGRIRKTSMGPQGSEAWEAVQ